MSDQLPKDIIEERPHAERSASQLKNLAVCAGYLPQKGKKRQHWVTLQGIRGHGAMETEDDGDLESDYEVALVDLCRRYEGSLPAAIHEVTESRVETIEGRWGYLDKLRFRKPDGVTVEEAAAPEIKIALATEADLIDYKFVKKKEVEDAEINLQGKDYVIGILEKYTHLQKVHVHFVMPRFMKVTFGTFTREQLPQLKLEVFAILFRARRTDRKNPSSKLFTPSYDVCRFCARATCPKMFQLAAQVAKPYATEPLPELPEQIHASKNDDPKQLGALKIVAGVLGPWSDSVNHHVQEKALDDHILPEGFEIAYQKGQRVVLNPYEVFAVAREFGLELADIIDASKISVKQLEDKIMARAPKGQKGKSKAKFLDALRDRGAIERREDTPFLQRKIEQTNQ